MKIRDHLRELMREGMTPSARHAAAAHEESKLEEIRPALTRTEYEEILSLIHDLRDSFLRSGGFRARLCLLGPIPVEERPRGLAAGRFIVSIEAADSACDAREAACDAARRLSEGTCVSVERPGTGERWAVRVEPLNQPQTADRESWKKLERGDRTTPEETRAMMAQIEAALPYLEAWCPEYALAMRDAVHTRENLKIRLRGLLDEERA